jgi:hypothetical protein
MQQQTTVWHKRNRPAYGKPAEFNASNSTRFGAVKGEPLAPLCYWQICTVRQR